MRNHGSMFRWSSPSILLLAAVTAAGAAQSPYTGSPIRLPAVFEAENFDLGGEGVAYHDTTAGNVFGVYRGDGMDVGAIPAGSGGGYHVGFLADGEWVEYTVDVPRTQAYDLRLWYASDFAGPNNFHVELDGVNVTGNQTAAYTAGWHNYTIKTIPGVVLSAGAGKVLRIAFDTGAWNLDKIEVRGQVPWGGVAAPVPGVVQAENFDLGGEGVAYHDTTAGNVFGVYRGDDMDVGAIPAGGHHVGFVGAGEWAEYTLNVTQTQPYELLMRVASADSLQPVNYHVELDGVNLTGTRTVPNTGGWHVYTNQTIQVGTLAAGANRVLRVAFDLNAFNLDRLELKAASCSVPAIITHPQGGTFGTSTQVTLSVTASGSAPLSYQWYRNGAAVAGATGPTLALGTVSHDETGSYFVRVSNSCGSRDSNTATVLLTCGPGELEQTLSNVLQGKHVVCPWTTQYGANFPNSMGGGSYNLPVLAAAIAAVVDPNMAGPDAQNPGVRGWWRKYLQGEVGDRGTVWAFGGKEPFSHVYQHYNIAAVMAVNHQARARGWTDVRDLARRWLRATFALMAATAVDKPKTFHERGTITNWSDGYTGPWSATGGMRAWGTGSWGFSYRHILMARAIGLATNAGLEPSYQTSLRLFLEGADNGWNVATEGDVYGLTTSEKSALAAIKTSHALPSGFTTWISGIRTISRYHVVAWPGVRATLMERNCNFNTVPTYGFAFFDAPRHATGKEAHALYPWGGAIHNCIRHGVGTIDPQRTWIEVWNEPAPAYPNGPLNCTGDPTRNPPTPPAHPEVTVRIDGLPGGTPSYHVILAATGGNC